jgi:hypothetical protein
MPPDLSKLSDKDLEALAGGDITKVSDAGLSILSGETPRKKTKQEQINEALIIPQRSPMSLGSVDDILRQLGLTARAAVTGAASLPAMLADVPAGLVNIAAGRQIFKPQTQALSETLTMMGLPEPKTSQERVVQDITSALGGVAAPAKVATQMGPAASKFFAENLGAQTAAAIGGAGASGYAKEEGASPFMQMMGSIAGAAAPGAGSALLPAAGRAAREVVRPFTEAGREAITGGVLRQLSREPEVAMKAMEGYQSPVSGYTPTAAQASRDLGLISAETSIRGLDTTGKFAAQAGQANQARMAILDRLAKDEAALSGAVTKRDEVTAPLREEAFAKATVNPETFQSAVNLTVNKTIDDILNSDAGARSTVESTMKWAKSQIERGTTPQRLYEVRKDLRDASQGRLDKDGAAYSLAKGQLEQVIRSVDDAIDAAAPGYKDYLKKYAQSSKGIERLEAAQEFKGKVLSTTPDPSRVGDYMISQPSFTRAIRAAEKETDLSKTQLAVLKKVAEDLDSGVLNRAGRVPGSDTFKNLSTANVIGAFIGKQMFGEVPASVSKVAAPMNWLYNGTDDQIRELLVDAMLDPKLASRLMSKASVVSIEPLSKELQRKAIAAGYGASFGLTE